MAPSPASTLKRKTEVKAEIETGHRIVVNNLILLVKEIVETEF